MSKETSILYFSATGTTAKIVKEIAKGIGEPVKEYDLTLPANRERKLSFDSDNLVIVGVPVYSGRVPGILADYLSGIKGNNTRAVFIVVYGNRDYDDALLELKDIMEKNGFIGVAAGAFIGEHSYTSKVAAGRPDEDDLQTAIKFGRDIKAKLNTKNHDLSTTKLIVKGKFPYKEIKSAPPIAPETDDICINCGACAENCPTQAIDYSNFKDIDAAKCVKCCSCIKKCPVSAKAFRHESMDASIKWLTVNVSTVRKEPTIFC